MEAQKIAYEYKIPYSRSSVLASAILGSFILIAGIAFAVFAGMRMALLASLLGLYLLWQAFKRRSNKGPQLMIGPAGIWTAATGHLPWARALPAFKVTAHRNVATTHVVILHRQSLHTELASFGAEELDVDNDALRAYLNEFAPEKVETIL